METNTAKNRLDDMLERYPHCFRHSYVMLL